MCPQRIDTRVEARRARSGSGLLNVGDAMTGERVSRGARRGVVTAGGARARLRENQCGRWAPGAGAFISARIPLRVIVTGYKGRNARPKIFEARHAGHLDHARHAAKAPSRCMQYQSRH